MGPLTYIDFHNIEEALKGPVPDLIISTWQEVSAAHRATGQYVAATSFTRMFPYQGNPLSVAVANTTPYAQVLEEGHAGFHLPSRIQWPTPKSHMSKKGVYYLRVPLRHFTPGGEGGGISSWRARAAMPQSVYRDALRMFKGDRRAAARVDAAGRWISRPYGAMPDVPQWLTRYAMSHEGTPGYQWRARQYAGLTRTTQTSAETGVTSSTYHTFRTLSQTSAGWWIPPMEGFHFVKQVVDKLRDQLGEIISAAIGRDVADIISVKVAMP